MKPVTVWYGRLPLRWTDPSFRDILRVADKFLTKDRAAGNEFRSAVDRLRETCSCEMSVLIDELEHRWQHREPSLYGFCSEVTSGRPLCINGQPVPNPLMSTKLGKTDVSLAQRFKTYLSRGTLQRGSIVEGTVELRLAVFGSGEAMVGELDMLRYAKAREPRLTAGTDPDAYLTTESFYGETILHTVHEFLQQDGARFKDTARGTPPVLSPPLGEDQ